MTNHSERYLFAIIFLSLHSSSFSVSGMEVKNDNPMSTKNMESMKKKKPHQKELSNWNTIWIGTTVQTTSNRTVIYMSQWNLCIFEAEMIHEGATVISGDSSAS